MKAAVCDCASVRTSEAPPQLVRSFRFFAKLAVVLSPASAAAFPVLCPVVIDLVVSRGGASESAAISPDAELLASELLFLFDSAYTSPVGLPIHDNLPGVSSRGGAYSGHGPAEGHHHVIRADKAAAP